MIILYLIMRKLLQWLTVFCSSVCWGQQQDMQFTKSWGLSDNMTYSALNFSAQINNGDYVVIGSKAMNMWGDKLFYFCRMDSSGLIKYEITWGNLNVSNYVSQVVALEDGDFLVCGTGYAVGEDFMLTKISCDGEISFTRYFHFLIEDRALGVTLTADSCFVLCGVANFASITSYPAFVKVDYNGNEVWRRTQSALVGYFPLKIEHTKDSGFVVCGSRDLFSETYCSKFDINGYQEWTKFHFGVSTNYFNAPLGIRGNGDGSIDVLYRVNMSSLLPPVSERSLIVHCDSSGDTLYSKRIADDITGVFLVEEDRFHVISDMRNYQLLDSSGQLSFVLTSSAHYPNYCSPTQDNGFFVAGFVETNSSNYTNTRFQVTKYGSNGEYYAWPFAENVSVYPNPAFAGQMNVSFDVQSDEQVEILLWSTTGVLVKTNSIFCPANSNTIMPVLSEGDVLASGSYILEIRADDQSYRQIVIIWNTTLKDN